MLQQQPSSLTISPEEARRELAGRELARRHLVDFSEYMYPNWYRAAAHHRLVGEMLEQVETYVRTKGKTGIGRLLILEPPRYGKSEQASRHFPAWILGKLPDTRIILTSYGADLAGKHSRAARDLVDGDRYRAVFGDLATVEAPVELSEESRAVNAWDLGAPHRGGLTAAGVGGGITGSGANLFIVDDPFKNREEAESEARRNSVWEWWTSTAYTRLEDGAAVVGMLTRWHQDDWAGRLLKAMASDPKADRWVVLCLPALWREPEIPDGKTFEQYQHEKLLEGVWLDQADPMGRTAGQALWPTKYNEEDLERIAANVGPYDFEALYQQWPYLRSGSFFKREWFTIVDAVKPDELVQRIRVWDKAGTATGEGGDFAAGVLMSISKDEIIYVEHVVRGQWTPGKREDTILSTGKLDIQQRKGPRTVIWHQRDPASAGLDSAQATNRKLAKAGLVAHFEAVSGDKEVRAGPWSSACEGGMVRLVRGAWNEPFIEEHVAFPKGKFDDQVDAASTGYSKLIEKQGKRTVRSYQG